MPGPGHHPRESRARPPVFLQPRRARRAARGGARGPPSLGPLRAGPLSPLPATPSGPERSGTAPAPSGAHPTDPPPTPCCSLVSRQDNGGHRGFAYRVSPAGKEGVPGDRGRAGRRRGTFAGVTAERPAQAAPGTLPSLASPVRRSALSRRKQRLIRYPRPASQRRGNGRVAEGNRGGQRSGGARRGPQRNRVL